MKRWLRTAVILAMCLAAGLALRAFALGTVRILGASMNDTLLSGDVVLVTRWDRASVDYCDVVECRFPGRGETYVKRVIGLPGDEIRFSGGALVRNGERVGEAYVSSPTDDYAVTLGEDQYLLLGDNRAQSYDSRMSDIGPVGASDILGHARLVLWPLGRLGWVK